MNLVFRVFYLLLMMTGCCTANNGNMLNNMEQGIKGYVTEVTGNQMPGPGKVTDPGKAIKTTVYIYEATSLSQVDRDDPAPFYKAIRSTFIKSIESDKNGFFATDLPPGKYSLFTKVDGRFFANTFDGNNIIAPVDVEQGKITGVNIIINDKAAY